MVALRAKGETADEVGGLVTAMLRHAVRVEGAGTVLDVVGTGGDRAHTVNISTMAAIVAAAAGARVVKHGNRAATSKTGTADVLEELGVVITLPADRVVPCLQRAGIAFCFAPTFHPAMRHAAVPRRELGVPTVFNVLGPLANPAEPAAALVGCADRRLAPVMAGVLAARGVRALVVRGDDGLDEITTATTTTVWDTRPGDGSVVETRLDPAGLGIAAPAPGALQGGEAAENAAVLRAVMRGEPGPVRDAVLLNAAAALAAWDAATGDRCCPSTWPWPPPCPGRRPRSTGASRPSSSTAGSSRPGTSPGATGRRRRPDVATGGDGGPRRDRAGAAGTARREQQSPGRCQPAPRLNAASRSCREYARNAMCVSVLRMPGTAAIRSDTTSATASWSATRTSATRSSSPVTL